MIDTRVESFLDVCKTMNYTRTAENLNMTQPAVSQHIRCLEDFYQTRLFTYKNKKLELTEQGRYLKKYLETIAHDVKNLQESVQNIRKRIRIRLGATLSIGEFYLPGKLSSFMHNNPKVDVSVIIADTRDLLLKLEHGEVDFILCEGYFDKNDYAYRLIKKEEMCIVCCAEYDSGKVSELKHLFEHPMICRESGSGTREIFENYLREYNYSFDNFISISEFTSPHLIKKLLMDGQGISVLYKAVVEEELQKKSLRVIEIPGFQVSHEFNAVWKKDSVFAEQYREWIDLLLDSNREGMKIQR